MKAQHYMLVALAALALFFALGSSGGYDAGILSLGGALACFAGSVAVIWASLFTIDRLSNEREGKQ